VHEYKHRSASTSTLPPAPFSTREPYETAVPQLTQLIAVCRDPDLRPFVTQRKVYFWPIDHTSAVLVPIATARLQEDAKCPAFPSKTESNF